MRICICLSLLFFTTLSYGQNKRICITVDDLPIVNYGITDSSYQKLLITNLTESMKKNNIPAIGFIIGKRLYDETGIGYLQRELLINWIEHGLEIGNHTYSHNDFNTISCKEYAQDILDGETVLKKILGNKYKSMKYFRHPYLHTGDTKEKSDSLNNFLTAHGYSTAPVTIDNDDYLFAVAYHRANVQNNKELMLKISHDYINYMERKLKYYEAESKNLFGRNINHILLIHASLLNSEYLDSLAVMFRKNGYDFVDMDTALKDDAYKTEITAYGKKGLSWLDRWALSQGKPKEFFKDDPTVPDYILELSKR
jgi:peptidoglycan/xylan/chitin deacetylase (PgdA/CDA1 family)